MSQNSPADPTDADLRDTENNCKRCSYPVKSGTFYCLNCGRIDWFSIMFFFVVSLILIGIGVFLCGAGFWRWFWIVLGMLCGLLAAFLTIDVLYSTKLQPGGFCLVVAFCFIPVAVGCFICAPGFWRWFWIINGVIIIWTAVAMIISSLIPQKQHKSTYAKNSDFDDRCFGFGFIIIASLSLMWLGLAKGAMAIAIIVTFCLAVLFVIWFAVRPSKTYGWLVWGALFTILTVLDLMFVISYWVTQEWILAFAIVGTIAHAFMAFLSVGAFIGTKTTQS